MTYKERLLIDALDKATSAQRTLFAALKEFMESSERETLYLRDPLISPTPTTIPLEERP